MITSSLFDDVLIQPVQQGADRLLVVSGYASSAMVSFHFDRVREKKKELSVKLIVGMCGRDGLPVSYHRGFQKLALEDYPQNFECSYIYRSAPVHSKVYIWLKDEEPFASFAGSANYTQIAFGSKQREVLAPCDPHQSLAYFKSLEPDSIFCSDPDAETEIRIYSDPQYFKRPKEAIDAGEGLQT
ncbi:MAG TPA: hypothetical protein DEP46_17775, partial [Blastocatellia bacterium]|nr:hypothetical protein [Blastocatellia bacterium]